MCRAGAVDLWRVVATIYGRAGASSAVADFYTFRVSDRRRAYSVSGTRGKQTFASSGRLAGTVRVRLHVQVTAGRRVCGV